MRSPWIGAAAIALAALAPAGCRESKIRSAPSQAPAGPPAPLLVASVEPPDGATEVAEEAEIRVRFSRAVDPATITAVTLRVVRETTGTPVEGTFAFEDGGAVVVFRPRTPLLAPSQAYAIELEPCIRAADGGALDLAGSAAPIPSRFTTRGTPDTEPPWFFYFVRRAEAVSSTAVRLEWFPAIDPGYLTPPGAIRYAIYMGRAPDPVDLAAPVAVVEDGATSFVVRDLEPATEYAFIVRARDLAGNEDDNEVAVTARTWASDVPTSLTILYGADVAGNLEPCG